METKRNPRTRKGRGIKTRNTVDRDVWCGYRRYSQDGCLDAPDDMPAGSTVQIIVKSIGPYLATSMCSRPGWWG